MSTFVVRFVGDPTKGYRGRVRHVASGEEANFISLEALLAFFDQLNAVRPHGSDDEDLAVAPAQPADAGRDARSPRLDGRERQ